MSILNIKQILFATRIFRNYTKANVTMNPMKTYELQYLKLRLEEGPTSLWGQSKEQPSQAKLSFQKNL